MQSATPYFAIFCNGVRSNRIIPIKNNGNWTTTDVTDFKIANLHSQQKAEAMVVIYQPKSDN